jgi:hypothetical protein
MARRYAISGTDTNTASTTLIGLTSAATVRPKIYDFVVGSAATPADNAFEFQLKRYTAAGTSTSVTPQALDPGDPAALAAGGVNHSGEPTYTANAILFDTAVNQRATFRWVASPGGEIILPATAANGVGLFSTAVGGSAYTVLMTVHYEE